MNIIKCVAPLLLLSLFVYGDLKAQDNPIDSDLKAALETDSLFWQHYNACNTEAMRDFFTDDIEFYHDKGGIINGLEQFLTVSKRNLCSDDNFRLRREAVPGTVKIFPMKDGDKLYGAILSGQHMFYVLEKGKDPRREGLARFTHLMTKTEDGWRMSRVLSYDHGPAPYENKRKGIVLNEKELRRYDGTYNAPQSGACQVKHANGSLLLTSGNQTFKLLPESKNTFFVIDRDLTFEFTNERIIVREQGKVVEEAIRTK